MTSRRAALKALGVVLLAACDATIAKLRGFKIVPVTSLDKVRPGAAYRTRFHDDPIIVVNADGEIRTFIAICTHEGCPLGWNPNQRLIRCPCHGSAFDTRGHVVNGPAKLPLTELETIVDRGQVSIVDRGKAPIDR